MPAALARSALGLKSSRGLLASALRCTEVGRLALHSAGLSDARLGGAGLGGARLGCKALNLKTLGSKALGTEALVRERSGLGGAELQRAGIR